MRRTTAGLLVLAAAQLLTGAWALLGPASFYRDFPGLGAGWVAVDGPFNHHLVVDAGAGFAATGVGLVLAAVWASRRVRLVALLAYLAHTVPHALFHLGHVPSALPPAQQVLTWLPLTGGLVLAVALAAAVARSGRAAAPAPPTTAAAAAGARIDGVRGRPRNLLLRAAWVAARRRLGTVPAAWRVTARVPRVALARAVADAAHQRTALVPARLGALATLRAATLVQCPFCVDILSAVAAHEGVTAEQVHALARWRDAVIFDDDERLALALADAMTATPATVDDDLAGALIDRFGPEGVIELAAAIGHENARARANVALGVAPEGFAAAAACPLPEVATP